MSGKKTGLTGYESSYDMGQLRANEVDGYNASALFQSNEKFNRIEALCFNDLSKCNANGWYFNPDAYDSCISKINNISLEVENICSNIAGINVDLSSPEGQDIEGSISSCFNNLLFHIGQLGEGIWHCGVWGYLRYERGKEAEQKSFGEAKRLKSLHRYKGKTTNNVYESSIEEVARKSRENRLEYNENMKLVYKNAIKNGENPWVKMAEYDLIGNTWMAGNMASGAVQYGEEIGDFFITILGCNGAADAVKKDWAGDFQKRFNQFIKNKAKENNMPVNSFQNEENEKKLRRYGKIGTELGTVVLTGNMLGSRATNILLSVSQAGKTAEAAYNDSSFKEDDVYANNRVWASTAASFAWNMITLEGLNWGHDKIVEKGFKALDPHFVNQLTEAEVAGYQLKRTAFETAYFYLSTAAKSVNGIFQSNLKGQNTSFEAEWTKLEQEDYMRIAKEIALGGSIPSAVWCICDLSELPIWLEEVEYIYLR